MILELATNDEVMELLLSAQAMRMTTSSTLGLGDRRIKFNDKWYSQRDIEFEIDRRVKYGKVIKL